MAAVLFGAAGTLAVPMFWAYLVLFAVLCQTASAAVYLLSPDLVKERVRPGEGEQDRVTVRALNLLMFVQLLLAGLDVGRLHWSATVPFPLQILGLVGFATGMGLTTWAMLVNRFFSSAVRLQPDRGQQVVSSGPYRLVRHPGYSGGLLLLLSAVLGEQRHSPSLPKAWCSLFDRTTQPHRCDACGKTCGRIGFDSDTAH